MTALDRYLRLEAVGLWREAPDAETREVIVSFGRTTLLFTDLRERPLGHWPLAGIRVLDGNDAAGATVYAMSDGETLSVRDPDMVAAIAAVCGARPALRVQARGRRRDLAGIACFLALLLLAVIGFYYVRTLRP